MIRNRLRQQMRVCCKKRWYREIPLSSFFIQDEGVYYLSKG